LPSEEADKRLEMASNIQDKDVEETPSRYLHNLNRAGKNARMRKRRNRNRRRRRRNRNRRNRLFTNKSYVNKEPTSLLTNKNYVKESNNLFTNKNYVRESTQQRLSSTEQMDVTENLGGCSGTSRSICAIFNTGSPTSPTTTAATTTTTTTTSIDPNNMCEKEHNICLSLDMSGSVSKPNFDVMRNFTSSLVTELVKKSSAILFSVVTFATKAKIASGLSTGAATLSTLSDIVHTYQFGTNTAAGIEECQKTFESSPPDRINTIVIITDGMPYPDNGKAEAAATSAKGKGTNIIPVFISTDPAKDKQGLDFMAKITTTGNVEKVGGFDELKKILASLVTEVYPC
jgi:uncharacterized protein YegL